ncbi:MAG: hypothetical protein V4463_10195 [Pseudomonadota bacterium]
MCAQVTMTLTEEDIELIKEIRAYFDMRTDTGTIGLSLRMAGFITKELKKGRQVAFLDEEGEPELRMVITEEAAAC